MEIKYDVTFYVICFNQENTIVQALESVKYQVECYGKNYTTQLIIGDDGSTDFTVQLIRNWLHINESIFCKVDKLFSDINQGTCRNLISVLRKAKGKWLKALSGDDLLPKTNLFSIIEKHKEADIIGVNALSFSKKGFYHELGNYWPYLNQVYLNNKRLKYLNEKGIYLIINGAIWRSKLCSEKLLERLKDYKLVEDRIQWYTIVKDNDIHFEFDKDIGILYRNDNKGISTSPNRSSAFVNDILKYYDFVIDDNKSILSKFSAFCLKQQFLGKRIFLYLNPINYYTKLLQIRNKLVINQLYRYIISMIPENQEYIDKLSSIFQNYEK